MDALPHYQNSTHVPAKFHLHKLPDGAVSVCWTDGTSSGERFYRWITGVSELVGPRRVAGAGEALPGEILAVSRAWS